MGKRRRSQSRAMAPVKRQAHMSAARPAYEAADPVSQDLAMWMPGLASADADWLGERNGVVARGRDLRRNNGWVSGGTRREIDAVIGASMRLSYKPDYRALGVTPEWADEFARRIESRWRIFANDPDFLADAARHDTVSGLFGLAYGHSAIDGDALAALLWLPGRGEWATTIQVIDPDRLSNPNGMYDQQLLRGGVHIDHYGAAIGYHIRRAHPNDRAMFAADSMIWDYMPRETPWRRPMMVHFFEKERAGQSRGVSRLAPVIEALFMDHKLGRTELQAATINAILAAFITSPFDSEMVAQSLAPDSETLGAYQEGRAAFHDERRITLGGSQITTLFPGETVEMPNATRPNAAFADFESAVLRKVASGTGLSYEQLTQDWSKVNYSSARAALIEVWRGFTARREKFTQGFCTPIFAAWLEEEMTIGGYQLPAGVPAFHSAKAAWTRCKWIGPARGYIDPTKEAEASGMRMGFNLSTLEAESAEQGRDWQEDIDQRAAEQRYMAARGVEMPALPKKATPNPASGNGDNTQDAA